MATSGGPPSGIVHRGSEARSIRLPPRRYVSIPVRRAPTGEASGRAYREPVAARPRGFVQGPHGRPTPGGPFTCGELRRRVSSTRSTRSPGDPSQSHRWKTHLLEGLAERGSPTPPSRLPGHCKDYSGHQDCQSVPLGARAPSYVHRSHHRHSHSPASPGSPGPASSRGHGALQHRGLPSKGPGLRYSESGGVGDRPTL